MTDPHLKIPYDVLLSQHRATVDLIYQKTLELDRLEEGNRELVKQLVRWQSRFRVAQTKILCLRKELSIKNKMGY